MTPHPRHVKHTAATDSLDVISAQARARVFATLLSAGIISRTQIARETGLSPSTVTKVVTPLVSSGYVTELGAHRGRGGAGRPQRMLTVNNALYRVIGVKLHPSHVTGVV